MGGGRSQPVDDQPPVGGAAEDIQVDEQRCT